MNAPEAAPSLTVRASSWGALFDCAMRWEAMNLKGIKKPSGLRAALGTAIHASTAVFDRSRIDGTGLSADDAAGALVDTLKNPGYDVDLSQDDLTIPEAEKTGLILHTKYCREISPRYEFRAVEMETKPLDIYCGGGVVVRLTGTMDRSRLRKGTGGLGISDLKSGANAVQKGAAKIDGHGPQIATYELLYEHTTGEAITEPGEIIGLKTKGTPEVATNEIRNAKRIMVGTDTQRGLIEFAAEMFRSGLFPPNPKSMLCGEKYCPIYNQCIYHE